MKKLLFLIILISFSKVLNAQDSLSLQKAIEIMLYENFSIQSLTKSVKVSSINNTWENAGRYPTIDWVTNYSLAQNNNSNDNWTQGNLNSSLELNWILFDGFKVNIRKDRFEELEALSEGNLQVLVEQNIQTMVTVYYLVKLAQEKINISKFICEQSKERLDLSERKNKIGLDGSYEVLQAKSAYFEDLNSLKTQEFNYRTSLRQLNQLIGKTPEIVYQLSDSLPLPIDTYEIEHLIERTKLDNKLYQNQLILLNLAEQEYHLAQANYYPTLSFQSGLQSNYRHGEIPQGNFANANSYGPYVGLNLKFNIYSGGEKKRATQIARIGIDIAQLKRSEMESQISMELYTALDNYRLRKELYNYAHENMNAAELNFELSKSKFEAGTINSFNFRDVQILYRNALLAKLEANYELISAKLVLVQLTGGLTKSTYIK